MGLVQRMLCKHCVGCQYSPFYSSSCSVAPALRTHIEIMRRAGPRACRVSRHCVGCHYCPFYSSSCSERPALRSQVEITRRVGAHATQARQAPRRLPLRSFLQWLRLGSACPANSNGTHVPSRCSCIAGYAGAASAVATVFSTAAQAHRCLPCELKKEVMCRGGAHAMQVVQALRRSPLRSFLQQLMLRDICPANSNGDHVPSRNSCKCRLCRHCVSCHYGHCYSSSGSEVPAL